MSVNVPVVPLRSLAPDVALRRLELAVGPRIDGLLTGDHLGLLPGPGSENADARLYLPGQDDVRRIDWNVTARTGDVHVRDAVADRELETWALVDASASMDFGTAAMEKRDVAAAVTVALAYIASRSGDTFGAYAVGPYGVQSSPLRSGRAHQLMVLRALCSASRGEPGGAQATLADGLVRLARHRRRGLRIVVSDLLDPDPSAWAVPLRRLAAGQRVVVVEVVDPRELDLPAMGYLTLVDPETGRSREVDTGSRRLRDRYAKVAREHRAANAAAVRAAGAAHLVVGTDGDWLRELVRFVARQRRLRLAGGPTAPAHVRVPVPASAGGTS